MTRRPALTDAVIEALETSVSFLAVTHDGLDTGWEDSTQNQLARAIKYINDLTAWRRGLDLDELLEPPRRQG